MTITIAGRKKEYAEGTTIAQIMKLKKVENSTLCNSFIK